MTNAVAAPKSEQIGQIRPRLARAIEMIVHTGASITKAAEDAGLRRESLQKALKKPHVRAHLEHVKRAWLDSETFVAWGRVIELANSATSEDVRLKAARTILESAGELGPGSRGEPPRGIQGVQIIVTSSRQESSTQLVGVNGVFEAPPYNPAGASD